MTQMHRTADALKQMMDHVATSYDVADRAQKKTQIRERLGAAHYQALTAQQTGVNANANANTRIVDGNDTVHSNHIAANQILNSHISDNGVNSRHIAASNVVSTHIASASILGTHISTGAVGSGQIANGAIVSSDVNGSYRNGSNSTYSLRTLDNSGGGAAPFCATPFMHLNREKRLAHLAARKELLKQAQGPREQTATALARRVEVLEHNLLNALSMLMDYEGLSGDEREEWLATDSESAQRYKELTGVMERDPATNNAKFHLERKIDREGEQRDGVTS